MIRAASKEPPGRGGGGRSSQYGPVLDELARRQGNLGDPLPPGVRGLPAHGAVRSGRSPLPTWRGRKRRQGGREAFPRAPERTLNGAHAALRREPAPVRGVLPAIRGRIRPQRGHPAPRPRARLQQPAGFLGGALPAARVLGARCGGDQAHQPVRRGDRAERGGGGLPSEGLRSRVDLRRHRGRQPRAGHDGRAELAGIFVEILFAPAFAPDALEASERPRRSAGPPAPVRERPRPSSSPQRLGGVLAQSADLTDLDPAALKTVSRRPPTDEERRALRFAWRVAKHVKSNAIVLAPPSRWSAWAPGR